MNRPLPYELLPKVFLPWYEENRRELPWRRDREPYHIWLSEIMLQQTRVEAVKEYYQRFLTALPTIEALAQAKEELLLKLWEGLGYYHRAHNLQKAARQIMEKWGGVFPQTQEEILSLPGIGDYTAGAIASICFDLPTPAIDGNVLRLLTRIGADFTPLRSAALKKKLAAGLMAVYPREHCGDFTQALIEAGALVCLPHGAPRCNQCPAQDFCRAYGEGLTARLPVQPVKKERRIQQRTVFCFLKDRRLALAKRPARGLLANLWELPNLAGSLNFQEACAAALELLGPEEASYLVPLRVLERSHIFSHVEWHMTCYYFQVGKSTAIPQEAAADPPAAGREKLSPNAGEAGVGSDFMGLTEAWSVPKSLSQAAAKAPEAAGYFRTENILAEAAETYKAEAGLREEKSSSQAVGSIKLPASVSLKRGNNFVPETASPEKTAGYPAEGLVWVTQQQLEKEYALPTAFRQFLTD